MPIRVLIVSPQSPHLENIRRVFESNTAFELVGTAPTQARADELAAMLRPDATVVVHAPASVVADDARTPRPDPLARLSPREREVFELLVEGARTIDVAQRLGISAKTADTHRTHIMRKLEVHSIVHLVRYAARHNLLPDRPPAIERNDVSENRTERRAV